MKQRAHFSQIFLKNNKYREKIAAVIPNQNKYIFEIGSGQGELSEILAKKADFLYCLEIDPKLAKGCAEKLKNHSKVKVINCDFRKVNLFEYKKNFLIYSSVPYYLSRCFIDYLIHYRQLIEEAFLILQKEFALKLIAAPKGNNYRAISCITQYYCQIDRYFNIPASAFSPRPKVDSCLVGLKFYQEKIKPDKTHVCFRKVVDICFSQKRKKIGTILRPFFASETGDFLLKAGINLAKRAQELSVNDFSKLSNYLFKRNFFEKEANCLKFTNKAFLV